MSEYNERALTVLVISTKKTLTFSKHSISFFIFIYLRFCMGCRDILLTFSVALLLISLFQIWLFREGRQQVPELSIDSQLRKDRSTLASKNKKDDDDVQRLFQRYFKGRNFSVNNTNTRFEDSKRRIPSSPDRLHN